MSGSQSGCLDYPTCEFKFKGQKIARYAPPSDFNNLEEQVKKVFILIEVDEEDVTLILHHVKGFEACARQFGIYSNKTIESLGNIAHMFSFYEENV